MSLLSSSCFFSFIVSSSLFLSCLVFSRIVLSLFLCLSLSLSVSVFFLCLSLCFCLSLSLSLCLSVSVWCCVLWCCVVCVWCVVCVVWCVARLGTQKKPPCVDSKRPRVYRHHAHMCYHMCAWCRYTRGRFESPHGGFLDGHTEGRGRGERGEGGHRQVLLTKKSPRRVLTWPHKFTERNPWILPIRSLRIDREQLVPESSNHSLYLMNLFIFSNLEESAHTTHTNTTHTHTHQHNDPPTHPTPLPSPPSPLPPLAHAHANAHVHARVFVYVCVYAYVDVYVYV